MTSNNTFVDDSTECSICFEPLESAKAITLGCGHNWHLDCLKQQLELARPSKSKRLIFNGIRCGKCSAFCDHPELENITRWTDSLREKVDALVLEQLKNDSPDELKEVSNDRAAKAKLIEEGRRNYAFYLCGACDEPYFGGTVDCADDLEGELSTPEDRLCQSCSSKTQEVCQHTQEHRLHHVWKCRYCCNPSSFVCYGNVHFCTACHKRNSHRVAHARGGLTGQPPLEPIPCRGEDCPHPKPEGSDRHRNGSMLDCEQVYYCAACKSSPDAALNFLETPGSQNFITNPSGEDGTNGWQAVRAQHGRQMPIWNIENMETAVDGGSTMKNFVSSFNWSIMKQTVQLHRFVNDPSSVRIEVSAMFMGRTDCPSVFRLDAVVFNVQSTVIHRATTGQRNSPAEFWEKSTLVIEPMQGAHTVTLMISGKDTRFWAGNFGSKCCHCSVRVLGTEEELNNILIGQHQVVARAGRRNPHANQLDRQVRQRHNRQGHEGHERYQGERRMPPAQGRQANRAGGPQVNRTRNRRNMQQPPNYEYLRAHALDILLPVVMLFCVWLVQTR